MQEIWVQSLGWEDLLEKEMETHSSILASRIPWTEEPGRWQSIGSKRVGHDCMTITFTDFFMIQLLYLHMTTRKTIALTIQLLVSKVMFLFFNALSSFVIAFLPRSKSPSAMILEPKEIKSLTVSIVSPSICHGVMGLDAMIGIKSMYY